MEFTLKPIARIKSVFPDKFGIPRQSGLAPSLTSEIIFEKAFRNPDALRGLQDFSHIWLIWQFSENAEKAWSPTVRPPRLGGNKRMGVFATRSPFRPNGLGLSSVKIEEIRTDCKYGPVITVSGADLMDGTPIFDIKPYISTDCHPEALFGFQEKTIDYKLEVIFPKECKSKVPPQLLKGLTEVLAQDPRPSYQNDSGRIYGIRFSNMDVRFTVEHNILTVIEVF